VASTVTGARAASSASSTAVTTSQGS
jgi:hypothetical protein